ncbi:MAG: efflux transporter outer membrane subunit [Janthinobacterium lividum]
MTRRRAGVVALLAASVASCTAGPDYHLPDTAVARAPAATGPFVGAGNRAFAQAPLPPRWWHLYDDPRLDRFEEEALAANTDLRAADANLRRATFAIRERQSARTVQTDVSALADASQVGNYTLPTPGTAFAYSLGISLAYPLDLSGQIRRGIEAARDDAQAVEAARDQTRVAVAAAVARNYVAACSANVTLAATQRVLAVQRRTVDVTRRLQTGGRGTAFDVTRAQAALDQSAAAVPAIIAARRTALFALAALLGRPAANYPRDVEACAAPPAIRRPLPIGDGGALIRRRPDIRQAERSLAAATATVGIETSRLYPQVSLGGSAGVAGPFGTLGTGSTFGGSLGPLISWSFPNRKAVRARIGEAGATADMASAQFDGQVLTALRQTETALEAYAREIDRDRALEAARDDADRAAGQANRLFRFGRTGLLEVLTSQATLATAETTLAQSRATLADRQVDVFLSLGGGWE